MLLGHTILGFLHRSNRRPITNYFVALLCTFLSCSMSCFRCWLHTWIGSSIQTLILVTRRVTVIQLEYLSPMPVSPVKCRKNFECSSFLMVITPTLDDLDICDKRKNGHLGIVMLHGYLDSISRRRPFTGALSVTGR